MSSDAHDCCRCSGKMSVVKHDFMARIGDEIIVIKDVPAMVCDSCGEVEYGLDASREIDRIRKDLLAGRMRARPLVAGGERINHQQITGTYI
jgi:YgiT-type zinc finger domain-containing protein